MIDIEQTNVGNPKYELITFGFHHDDNIVEVF